MSALVLQHRLAVLNRVIGLVEKKHFNPALNGANWPELVERHRARVLAAEDTERFEGEIANLLSQLKTSHTGFFHRRLRSIPARHAINATFLPHRVNGATTWMFQDVHEGGPAFAAGIRPGDILLDINGELVLPPTQPVFAMGQAASLGVETLSGERRSIQLDIPTPKSRKRPIGQPRAVSWKVTRPGIGLLKIAMFPGAIGVDLARDIDRALSDFRECTRLIVDLRGNTGGGIGGLRLMSYLTPDKRPVGYSLTKKRAARGYRREDLIQFGRIPGRKLALIVLALRYALVEKSIAVITEGLGPRPFHGRVVIVVNEHSASAAEIVAAFARENKLATIVGRKTPGRLMSGGTFRAGHGFILGLPTAAYLTWEGTLIEGNGIEPEVAVELSREALKDGIDTQLEQAIEVAQAL
ncbi:MAG TPA: S41 family peptidase [Terriglobales bacterium]